MRPSEALGDIPAGGGVTVTVDPSTAGTVSDHAEVSSPVADPTPANGAASAKVAVRPAARPHRRLGLVLAASPRRVETGSVVDYTVTVDNPNAVPVAHVTVCDTVPIGVQQLSATPRGGLHGRTRCWTVAHLAAHASRWFTLRASVSTQRGGRLRNRATARAAGIGPTRAAVLLIARAARPHRRLGLVLAASPRRVETGSVVDYTVTVDNPNAVPVAHVTVSRAGIDGDLETRDWSLERGTPRSCHDRGSTRMS